MRILGLVIALVSVIPFGQARWSSTQAGRAAWAAFGAGVLVAASFVAGSIGPAVTIVGFLLIGVRLLRGRQANFAAIAFPFVGVALLFVGAFITRAAGP